MKNVVIILFLFCAKLTWAQSIQFPDSEGVVEHEVRYVIFQNPDNTFGYQITVDDLVFIEQNTIPAVAGNRGFDSHLEAEKVALIVIAKLINNEMPPSVTEEEILNAGIKLE